MREELMKKINENLKFAPDDYLETVSETLIGCQEAAEEESIERGLLFTRVENLINDISSFRIMDESQKLVKEIGFTVKDFDDETITFNDILCENKITLNINNEPVIVIEPQSPILTAFKELFRELNYSYPDYMGQA